MPTLPNRLVNPSSSVIWTGVSGTRYEFENVPVGIGFNPVPGVYIFTREIAPDRWHAIYIGETDNLARRLTEQLTAHHQFDRVYRAGATHICAMVVRGGKAERLRIETDLRHFHNPACNDQ